MVANGGNVIDAYGWVNAVAPSGLPVRGIIGIRPDPIMFVAVNCADVDKSEEFYTKLGFVRQVSSLILCVMCLQRVMMCVAKRSALRSLADAFLHIPPIICILHKQHKILVMYEQKQMNRNIRMLDLIRVKDNSNHPSLPNLYILHPLRTQWVFYYCRIRNVNRQWYPIQFCGR